MAEPIARRGPLQLVGTWPRRIGALAGSALVAWAVSAFAPPLWQHASTKVGLAPAPVQVSVLADPDRIGRTDLRGAPEFVLRKPAAAIGAAPSGDNADGRWAWAHAQGGVDATQTVVRLVIRGQDKPVVLDNLRIQILSRGRPLRGTLASYTGLGSATVPRTFYIDLDSTPAKVEHVNSRGEDDTAFPYQVSPSDIEVFDLVAQTAFHDVTWKVLLDYSSSAGTGTMTVGGPFHTTARADAETWAMHDLPNTPAWWGSGPAPQTFYYWSGGWRRG
jgi:hypothetical protein